MLQASLNLGIFRGQGIQCVNEGPCTPTHKPRPSLHHYLVASDLTMPVPFSASSVFLGRSALRENTALSCIKLWYLVG